MDINLKKTNTKENKLKSQLFDISSGDIEKLSKNFKKFNRYKKFFIIGIFTIMVLVAIVIPKENFRYVLLSGVIFVNIILLLKLFLEDIRVMLLWQGINEVLNKLDEDSEITLKEVFGVIEGEETKLIIGRKITPILESIEKLLIYMKKYILEEKKNEDMIDSLIEEVANEVSIPVKKMVEQLEIIKLNDTIPLENVEVLDDTANSLKKTIEDLIELSKAASGNLEINIEKTDVGALLKQALVEYEYELENSSLKLYKNMKEKQNFALIDGEKTWKVFGLLIDNIIKYSQKNSIVFIEMKEKDNKVIIEFKNISKEPLNIIADSYIIKNKEILNNKGSGLGLAMATALVHREDGNIDISIDGDLFKVVIEFNAIDKRGDH